MMEHIIDWQKSFKHHASVGDVVPEMVFVEPLLPQRIHWVWTEVVG